MITESLKLLGILVLAQINTHATSTDQKLVGSWTNKFAGQQIQITYSADHKYIRKWGRPKFTTGYYQEIGRWEILRGDRVQWTPESRKNIVSIRDGELAAEVNTYMKAMDEGAWKPLPRFIRFSGQDTYFEWTGIGKSKESTPFVRIKPRR